MKQRYNRHQQRPLLSFGLFITGALLGACEKPTTHSTTPESAPATTTTAPILTSTPDQGPQSSGALSFDTGEPQGSQPSIPENGASTSAGGNNTGWPGALSNSSSVGQLGTSTIKGCLSKPVPEQDNPTRGPHKTPASNFRVTPMGNGALVTHDFSHACCLSAKTETSLENTTITVRERLAGTPCRCVCESTIQTRLTVPPGEYQVKLVLETNGVQSDVGTAPLAVKKLTAP